MALEAVEAGLISSAISTVASVAASALIKPTQPKSPVSYPQNTIDRGGYLPLVMGRRIVGCHVGWVGNRGSFSQHTAARSSMGTTTPSANQYLEGGWHQLTHGPVRRLYRIWQGSQLLWHTLIDSTTTADGSTFQAGTVNNPGKTGDNFAWRSGRDPLDTPTGSAPWQPVDPYLQAQAGIVSAYPGLCDVIWHRKLLGGSPSWPLMKYEIETFPRRRHGRRRPDRHLHGRRHPDLLPREHAGHVRHAVCLRLVQRSPVAAGRHLHDDVSARGVQAERGGWLADILPDCAQLLLQRRHADRDHRNRRAVHGREWVDQGFRHAGRLRGG